MPLWRTHESIDDDVDTNHFFPPSQSKETEAIVRAERLPPEWEKLRIALSLSGVIRVDTLPLPGVPYCLNVFCEPPYWEPRLISSVTDPIVFTLGEFPTNDVP